jgi:hypothetical protein
VARSGVASEPFNGQESLEGPLLEVEGGLGEVGGRERADSTALLIVERALDGFVQPAHRQVRLDAAIERARARVLIKPQPQFLQLLLRQRSNRALEFFHFSSVHAVHRLSIQTCETRL